MKSLFESIKKGKLIGNYLTGKESDNELKEFKEWINKDNENKDLFNSIKDERQLSSSIREFDSFDKDIAWSKYSESISKKSKKTFYLSWSVAASIIVIVALSSIIQFNKDSNKKSIVQEITIPILPGKPKAFIELSGGTRFDLQSLDKEQRNRLSEHTGITVDQNNIIKSKTINANKKPELIAIVTPRGGEYKLILDDGTQVLLNADSRIEFPNKFAKKERKIKLTGEAYLIVSKDSNRPFIVDVNGIEIEVLGTEFNVTAYNNDDFIQTTLIEGKVLIKNPLTTHKPNILTPGKQANFNKHTKSIQIKTVDVNQYIAWKDGRFVFQYKTLGEITKILERWYDVDFIFANQQIKILRFSGEFLRYENIEKVYEIFQKTGTKLDFKQNGRTIELRNKKTGEK